MKFFFGRLKNIFGKRRKCWLPAFPPFFQHVFKIFFPRGFIDLIDSPMKRKKKKNVSSIEMRVLAHFFSTLTLHFARFYVFLRHFRLISSHSSHSSLTLRSLFAHSPLTLRSLISLRVTRHKNIFHILLSRQI